MTMTGGALTHSLLRPFVRCYGKGRFVALLHFTGCFLVRQVHPLPVTPTTRLSQNIELIALNVSDLIFFRPSVDGDRRGRGAPAVAATDPAKYTMLFITGVSLRPRRRGT